MFLYSLINTLLIFKNLEEHPTEELIKETEELMHAFNTADTPDAKCYILNKLRGDNIMDCIYLKKYQFKFPE